MREQVVSSCRGRPKRCLTFSADSAAFLCDLRGSKLFNTKNTRSRVAVTPSCPSNQRVFWEHAYCKVWLDAGPAVPMPMLYRFSFR